MGFWNKIDLHQHTLNELTTDGKTPKSLYTHSKFQQVLIEEKVKLKAVTNHNTLNIIDHVKHALICGKNAVQYLPGVEIDYRFKSKNFHAISILNPLNDVIHFSNVLEEKVRSKGNKITLDKDDFAEIHENIEYIFIPHVMKTQGVYPSVDKPILKEAEDWVMEVIQNGNFVPVIFENTKDYNKYTIYGKIEKLINNKNVDVSVACYVGSDYKFDNDIERRNTALSRVKYSIYSEPSYRGLEIAVRNHDTRIVHDDDKINRSNYITEILIKDNENFVANERIVLSPALNVIIGGSGTGKTLLLNEIFRTITNENLKDVVTSSRNSGKSAYINKVGNGVVELKTFDNVPLGSLKVIEIPNIYTEIMKYVNDYEKLGEVFNISNRNYINDAINKFIGKCDKYNNLKVNLSEYRSNGGENLRIIQSSIEFLTTNKVEKSKYNLSVKVIENSQSSKIEKIMENNENYINKKDSIIEYFHGIDKLLDLSYNELISRIIDDYIFLLKKLEEKNYILSKEKLQNKIDEAIEKLINSSIREISQKLGQREKIIKEREELFKENQVKLITNVKKALEDSGDIDRMILKYPYEEVKQIIESKNSNDLARFTLSFNEDYIKSITAEDDIFIESKNNLIKIRRAMPSILNLLDDASIKKFIDNLRDEGLNIVNILKGTPELNIELRLDSGEWKIATAVNQGTIAKVSMQYYFRNIMKAERPDVIFIDQPENDVDKDFLTKMLAKFLRNQKIESQVFITSHDAILTVNADANMIIQADVDSDNKINYLSYPLEYCEDNHLGTDDVANILDGGKGNVEKRYQIYGGILKYEN